MRVLFAWGSVAFLAAAAAAAAACGGAIAGPSSGDGVDGGTTTGGPTSPNAPGSPDAPDASRVCPAKPPASGAACVGDAVCNWYESWGGCVTTSAQCHDGHWNVLHAAGRGDLPPCEPRDSACSDQGGRCQYGGCGPGLRNVNPTACNGAYGWFCCAYEELRPDRCTPVDGTCVPHQSGDERVGSCPPDRIRDDRACEDPRDLCCLPIRIDTCASKGGTCVDSRDFACPLGTESDITSCANPLDACCVPLLITDAGAP